MEVNEQLIRAITQAVVEQLHQNGAQPEKEVQTPEASGSGSLAGRTRMRPKRSYETAVKAALMHIVETEQLDPEKGMIEWEGIR